MIPSSRVTKKSNIRLPAVKCLFSEQQPVSCAPVSCSPCQWTYLLPPLLPSLLQCPKTKKKTKITHAGNYQENYARSILFLSHSPQGSPPGNRPDDILTGSCLAPSTSNSLPEVDGSCNPLQDGRVTGCPAEPYKP